MITDEQGHIQWVNNAFTRMSGFALEEALGHKPAELLQGPETDPATVSLMARKLARGEGFNVELVNYAKNGRKYWVALDAQPVHDDGGQIKYYVAVEQDITERKRTELELRRQAQIIDQTHDAVVSIDLDGKINSWNKGAQALFGYTKDEALGSHIKMLHLEADHPLMDEKIFQPLFKKGRHELEIGARKKSGQEFTVLLSLSVLSNLRGEPAGMVGHALDITERKKVEEAVRQAKEAAETASRIKSEFLANMSHELRTPLNAIIGFSEILLDQTFGELNEKQTRQTKHILDSGSHLLSLINDILDLSKVESGKMELDLSVINLASWLESSLVLLKEKTAKHGIALDLEISDDERQLSFQADERKLKQIMFNLLSNAAKFTEDGGSITVSAARDENQLQISVRDTGVGLDPEDQERIFDEFEQVDSSLARGQQGTGLGLALTRKLVELHGGRIWVSSQGKNQGSTFSFTLPLNLRPQDDLAAESMPAEDADADRRPPADRTTVLVVDDDPMAREILGGYLEEGGYVVAMAADGSQGLELARKLRPSIITLDIQLPDINGFEVLRRIKEDKATAHIPVIIVSITDDRDRGMSLGATDFLEKPVNKDRLLQKMGDLVPCSPYGFQKVLVVDDNPADREMIATVLARRGCSIISAPGGAEGIEMALQERPDLIILDLQMPEISGWDVLEALRDRGGEWHPPILVFTGVTLSSQERQRLAGQVQAVVLKGGGKEDLLSEIDRLTHLTYRGS
jgi:PAS domain S-box-containing protein